jgi:hypothetical protein
LETVTVKTKDATSAASQVVVVVVVYFANFAVADFFCFIFFFGLSRSTSMGL